MNPAKMPVLFVGHGSPMNAFENNEFSDQWIKIGNQLPRPKAILCVSAHWYIKGCKVTAMEVPQTIHDFYGFPKELYQKIYPAPGSPELAKRIEQLITKTKVNNDQQWGLDHGCWSVLCHMFPNADIPVVQLSIDQGKDPSWHYKLCNELQMLRYEKVLIIASG